MTTAARTFLTVVVFASLFAPGTLARTARQAAGTSPAARPSDTLWIFEADFEDPWGQGWTTVDLSGTLGEENHWHKDTIRIRHFTHLGDSTWWCGKYDATWAQPRGYGNDWVQYLWHDFPLASWSGPGDEVTFTFDQRFAIEQEYDYGYVDLSTDDGETWTTLRLYSNPGFPGTPGASQDWDSALYGHQSLDMSAYAGSDVRLRFRFESEVAYSSQDQPDNPPLHSVKDGAWQLDNFTWHVWDSVAWTDDCESPGDNGWVHDDIPSTGQTGIVWRRSFENPGTDRFGPGWYMAAYDSLAGRMVDRQRAWLLSPPIDIEGVGNIVGKWEGWMHLPLCSHDEVALWVTSGETPADLFQHGGFEPWPAWGPHWGGPAGVQVAQDWSVYAGQNWLGLEWALMNGAPAEEPECHEKGFLLGRQLVGIVVANTDTEWEHSPWDRFYDTDDLGEALAETARVRIIDDDGIVSALLLAANQTGIWEAYPLLRPGAGSDEWVAAAPVGQVAVGAEILYYFEAIDGTGETTTFPSDAPDEPLEFSVLPINGSVEDPCILLVDKHGRSVPGADWQYRHTSEYYYREALDILGHVYDVFDVRVPGGTPPYSDGPETDCMEFYDTQIWFTGDIESYALNVTDQARLVGWLSDAVDRTERNLMVTGNDVNEWLGAGADTSSFLSLWLATGLVSGDLGDVQARLRDAAGGFDFMTHDDGECALHRGDYLARNDFDVIVPTEVVGAELIAEYVTPGREVHPAGVAYTHGTMGYQTVNLGYGFEFMMGEPLGGNYATGLHDRLDLMANVMDYFGKAPGGPGTTVPTAAELGDRLARAYPNPFGPATRVAYHVAAPGRVTIRVHDLAGRLVRTLVDEDVGAGAHEAVWDGSNDAGARAASGVYFLTMQSTGDGLTAKRKVVLMR